MEIARFQATSVKTDRWLRRTFQALIFTLGLVAILSPGGRSDLLGTLLVVLAVCVFLVVPISWAAADVVRRWIYPTAIYTRGFKDAMQKRIFWAVGPQVVSASTCCFIVLMPFAPELRELARNHYRADLHYAEQATVATATTDTSRVSEAGLPAAAETVRNMGGAHAIAPLASESAPISGPINATVEAQLEVPLLPAISETLMVEKTDLANNESGAAFPTTGSRQD